MEGPVLLSTLVERVIQLTKDAKKDVALFYENNKGCQPSDILKSMITIEKYYSLYSNYPTIVHVLIYCNIYNKDGIKAYVEEYNKETPKVNDHFKRLSNLYIDSFDEKFLNKHNLSIDQFRQFFRKMMDEIFNLLEKDTNEEAKRIDQQRAITNRELLNQRLSMIKK